VCPWNVRFARALPEGSPFTAREALAGRDARSLAREILVMDVEGYRAAFRGSPMKRAKLPAMKRHAAVVLGNDGSPEDVPILVGALAEDEPLVRGHAAWALGRIGSAGALEPLRAREAVEPEHWVLDELRAAAQALDG
jgi:epoxyqueuosine reductase